MDVVYLVLIGMGGELDRVELSVKDPENCAREILAAMTRRHWVLSIGDRIEIKAP